MSSEKKIKEVLRNIPKGEQSYPSDQQFAQKQDFMNQARQYKKSGPDGCRKILFQLIIFAASIAGFVFLLRGL